MKCKATIVVCIVFTLMIGLITISRAITFSDISGHWAEANINALAEKKIINGYEDGTFKPNGAIKKGEFIKLIMSSALLDEYWILTDTTYNHWAGTYINTAEDEGIIKIGTITDENANEEITRGEVVEILGRTDIILNGAWQESKKLEFYDIADMTDAQKAMLKHCVSRGYIEGYNDGTFKPERTLTRAEVATILTRYLEK